MGWDKGHKYYTRSRRVNGKVVREYIGGGEAGARAAQEDAQAREQRRATKAAEEAERAELEALDAKLDELDELVDLVVHAALTIAGYRQHNRGEWRKCRAPSRAPGKALTADTGKVPLDAERTVPSVANPGDSLEVVEPERAPQLDPGHHTEAPRTNPSQPGGRRIPGGSTPESGERFPVGTFLSVKRRPQGSPRNPSARGIELTRRPRNGFIEARHSEPRTGSGIERQPDLGREHRVRGSFPGG